MGKCWSKSNPANEPSDSQKPPESNRNKDLRAGEQQRHEVQRQQERRLTEEREAQAQHTGKGRRQAEEKLLICIGPPGSGKSQFIDSLTQQTQWAGGSLKQQEHGVRPFQLNSDLASTIILLDTPGFDALYKPVTEVFGEVQGWLQKEHKQNQVAGVLYFHNITDNRLTVRPPFHYLKKLCRDNPKKVFFITTHWDRPGKWDHKERELVNGQWKPFLDSGAQATRFNKTTTTARQIAQMVLLPPSA